MVVFKFTNFIDTTCDINETDNHPTKFLNTLEPPGVPSHTLELKIEGPIILLRNLHPPSLCNGTRLCIKKLMPNIIGATIMTEHAAAAYSFNLSINKAQGQSSEVVRLDHLNRCSSNGQLYVGKADSLYIKRKNSEYCVS
ncbi:hypothetical protein AVEN_233949-1 [Araneus ventricosus]|uniref:DNA helicase Pif1-like 2B domain-containing protein n=1 Tax=Araneus ventricosus TaxID=182803 RepID=A0A4Y2VHT1_ARAVE|nr:hypothetical protein AVEN_45206-1 [Araneus ventricosus]GBO23510.1 hypothetical protein AVEN_233949-1 [Araneus ventricosus]